MNLTDFQMDCLRPTESDESSTNEEFIDMDVGEDNAAMLSDGEIRSELEVIKRWSEALELNKNKMNKIKTSVGPKTSSNTPQATLKIHSVVEKPESTLNCSNVAEPRPRCDDTVMIETKTLSDMPLATPKIQSVVVIPESTLNRSKVAVPRPSATARIETKTAKRNSNQNGHAVEGSHAGSP